MPEPGPELRSDCTVRAGKVNTSEQVTDTHGNQRDRPQDVISETGLAGTRR